MVEALIAFSILVLGMTALYGSLSQMGSGERKAQAVRAAARIAQSKLELFALSKSVAGNAEGQDGTLRWRRSVQPYSQNPSLPPQGYWVSVKVWDDRESSRELVTLTTFRLVPRPR